MSFLINSDDGVCGFHPKVKEYNGYCLNWVHELRDLEIVDIEMNYRNMLLIGFPKKHKELRSVASGTFLSRFGINIG